MVCTLVYINTSFLIYKSKAVDRQMLLITTLYFFCNKNVDIGDQKRKWTDQIVSYNNSMSSSMYLLC